MPKDVWSFDKIQELADAVAAYGADFDRISSKVLRGMTKRQLRNAYYKLRREDPLLFAAPPALAKAPVLLWPMSEADSDLALELFDADLFWE
ncbi:hypothetical protein SS50377_24173 [Spironucleus salmonicida]|uniref:Myb-like DNA-binding domain-containing protein n=1 Tax=Spironucleus salmonicida TaxID=348837 RepID=V6LKL2_9EUKA|nr:hypothetical protein SS50377_24147 [Spironucleus salmonicida]KAH0574214.1 hypothetical protein SS50377_24161 [Spironucleus salmonicida]KAH0574218.1 hypothetical protein SS50377_24165 [Spironucleus salmonicida]KAH0574225.1 hypothetical protein SS50377_24173 [Spironucleus salmonicida]|eukprot:EST44266.1 Hypothetical protein SS50377_15929 [Spironucleus salmonicida]